MNIKRVENDCKNSCKKLEKNLKPGFTACGKGSSAVSLRYVLGKVTYQFKL